MHRQLRLGMKLSTFETLATTPERRRRSWRETREMLYSRNLLDQQFIVVEIKSVDDGMFETGVERGGH